MPDIYSIGANVVIEVAGRVVEQRRNFRGLLYVIQPHDRSLPRVYAPAETVFPPDDSEPQTDVIPFPVPAIMQ